MENDPKKVNKELLFAGHLEEIDDLKKWDRNAPLDYMREDNLEVLKKISDALADRIKKSGKKAVLFISSPKLRAQQTCEWIAEEIKTKLNSKIKIRYSTNENLDANHQGEFILPENYEAGTFFEGLKIAGKIYLNESLHSAENNLHYKFGDPLLQADGSYKYPELVKYFKDGGETYAQSLVRIFNSVIEMSDNAKKLEFSVEVIVVAHGFTYHILRGLSVLGEQVKKGEQTVNPGEVAQKLWEIYNTRSSELKNTGFGPLDFSNIEDGELISLLKREVDYLKR